MSSRGDLYYGRRHILRIEIKVGDSVLMEKGNSLEKLQRSLRVWSADFQTKIIPWGVLTLPPASPPEAKWSERSTKKPCYSRIGKPEFAKATRDLTDSNSQFGFLSTQTVLKLFSQAT